VYNRVIFFSNTKDKMPEESEDDIKLFQTIGLSEQKAKETLKNTNITKNLKLAINEVGDHPNKDFPNLTII